MKNKNKNKNKNNNPMVDLTIRMVSMEDLVVSKYNPPPRTRPSAVKALCADIAANGIHTPIQALANGMIFNGHRRHACAVALGLTHVPVIFYKGDERDIAPLWGKNGFAKSVGGAAWMYQWYTYTPSCDLKSKMVPPAFMKKIVDCWEVFGGKTGIKILVDLELPPFVGQRVKEAYLVMQKWKSTRDTVTLQEIGEWVLRHGNPSRKGMDYAYRTLEENYMRRVVAAVRRDIPLTKAELKNARGRID
jgi:hypothetical protein